MDPNDLPHCNSDSDSDSDYEEPEQKVSQPDQFKTHQEVFNQHKLSHIISQEAVYKTLMRPEIVSDENYNPFTIMKKYLAGSRGGEITVEYKQNAGVGRYYALGSLSLQSLPREIRHSIANEFYTDIDLVNAHPVILSYLCGLKKISTKYLDRYNNSRDACLKTLGVSREVGKTAILSLINGGSKAYDSLDKKPQWLLKLKREIEKIHKHFSLEDGFETHKSLREQKGITYNHAASYMNVKLCDYENRILQCMWVVLGSPVNCVLCFDGIMVLKDLVYDLSRLEKAVATELGIKIQLKVKEMDEGFDLPEVDLYKDPEYNRFDFEDPYTYQMFHSEFNRKSFESYAEMEEAVWNKARKVISLILDGEGSFIKKDKDGKSSTVKKLGKSNFTMTYTEDKKKQRITIEDFLGAHDAFGNYVCKMNKCPETDFNLWTGFQAKRRQTMDPRTQHMIDFFKKTWACGNEEIYNYLISWLAGLLTPGMNRTAVAMIAPPGTGKGFFLEFMKLILRQANVADMVGIQSITQKHNTAIQGKRLVVINEMSSTRDEFKSNFDKIKSFITDPVVTIEPKGVNPYSIDNIGNYLLFTNHRDAIIVEENDRRYAIFEMNTDNMNNIEYFNTLESQCFNQDVADSFYTYLLDYPNKVDVRKIPNTELRQEMMNLSKSTPLKFLDYALDEGKTEVWGEMNTIGAAAFYQHYADWCRDNGERNCHTSTKFGTALKGRLQKRKTMGKNVYILPTTL